MAMNPFIQEFIDLDRVRCRDRRLSNYDSFGSMLQFHINGNTMFKTTAGAFVTFGYYCSLIAIFVYYLFKFFKTDEPVIAWNQYRGETSSVVNLKEMGDHYYMFAFSMVEARYITYNEFWESFTLLATVRSGGNKDGFGPNGLKWKEVPIVSCATQQWPNEEKETESGQRKKQITESGICLDPEYVKLHHSGISEIVQDALVVTLYPCQDGYTQASKCTHKLKPEQILFTINIKEKSLDLNRYNDPAYVTNNELATAYLQKGIKYTYMFHYKDLVLHTDKGKILPSIETSTYPVIDTEKSKYQVEQKYDIPFDILS